jgi:hypothetical protein
VRMAADAGLVALPAPVARMAQKVVAALPVVPVPAARRAGTVKAAVVALVVPNEVDVINRVLTIHIRMFHF